MQRDDFEVQHYPGIDALGVSDRHSPLRVVIVTEEILGPVRNGGIASTYYHLARGLAVQGHEVHVLFLKGPVVQDETPEHWVDHYAKFGVRLHYLDLPTTTVWGAASTWQRRYAGAYTWLRDQEPFDVVHTSEWRGGLVYALMAKRLGLAFQDTLFLVKTSSPYIWNRHYQMQPITHADLLAASYAEQKCVELADVVIGGSAHLISFMDHIGYRMPDVNVHVQPNIMDFSNVPVVDARPGPPRRPGDVVKSRDFVFFGRLEARKGIETFCSAVDLLHERGEVPDSVTFLGKWSGALPAQGGQAPEEFVAEKAQTWDCRVQTVTDRHQADALSFLCERDVIAVMPSLIENSSMAVYEALEQRIPFIASAVGGSPELIAEQDQASCLVEPTAEALADRMERALLEGQVIAHPRFSNEENLQTWYGFHAHVGALIAEHGRSGAVERLTQGVDRRGAQIESLGYVALVRRGESLDDLVKALHGDQPDLVVLGYKEASARAEIERVRESLAELSAEVTVVNCLGNTSGEALNVLATARSCDAMVVSDGVGVVPKLGFFDAARRSLAAKPECLFTTFFDTDDLTVGMPLGGDVASQIVTARAFGPETVALRRDTFEAVGGFEPYDAQRGVVHEYVTRASEAGHDLLVFPETLLTWRSAMEEADDFRADPLYSYLSAKAVLDNSGLAQRKVLLSTLHTSGGMGGVDEKLLRDPGDEAARTHWLMPAAWTPDAGDEARHRRLLVALDSDTDELWLYARGPGERRLMVRGEEQPLERLVSHGDESSDDHLTISTFRVPKTWEQGHSYPIIWGLYSGEEKLRNLFLRVNKIGTATLALACRHAVLSTTRLTEIFEGRTAVTTTPVQPGSEEVVSMAVTDQEGAKHELPSVDPVDEYVSRAVSGAQGFLQQRGVADPYWLRMRSQELLREPPPTTPLPITPRSGIVPPLERDGWIAGDWLRGWAWDREERERCLHVLLQAGDETVMMVAADRVDRSLDEVPGRERHAFQIPVQPELLHTDQLRLVIWEGGTPVFRGRFLVERGDEPMLRRFRPTPVVTPEEPAEAVKLRKRWHWWRR